MGKNARVNQYNYSRGNVLKTYIAPKQLIINHSGGKIQLLACCFYCWQPYFITQGKAIMVAGEGGRGDGEIQGKAIMVAGEGGMAS